MTDRVDLTDLKWHIDPSECQPYELMPIKAKCDLFGNEGIVIEFRENHQIPNRWIRFWAKVFFNSKWTLIEDNERNITE